MFTAVRLGGVAHLRSTFTSRSPRALGVGVESGMESGPGGGVEDGGVSLIWDASSLLRPRMDVRMTLRSRCVLITPRNERSLEAIPWTGEPACVRVGGWYMRKI